jgi:hypothetical protein
VEENGLPLPLSTQQRYEAARQKRVALFKKDVVARHWRQVCVVCVVCVCVCARARVCVC